MRPAGYQTFTYLAVALEKHHKGLMHSTWKSDGGSETMKPVGDFHRLGSVLGVAFVILTLLAKRKGTWLAEVYLCHLF